METQKTPKFKVGDRVYLTKDYPITKKGWTGTVVERPKQWKSLAVPEVRVMVLWDHNKIPNYLHKEQPVDEYDLIPLSKLHKVLA